MKGVWFDEFPPFMVRILARRREGSRRSPLTLGEICARCRRGPQWVNRVSMLDSWDTLTYADMKAFADGCMMDPSKLYRDREYLARSMVNSTMSPLAHIQSLPEKQRKWMEALISAKEQGIISILRRICPNAS